MNKRELNEERAQSPNDPKLSDRSPEPPPLPGAARGEGAAGAGEPRREAPAVTEPVKPEPGVETERQGCGSLQRMVRRLPVEFKVVGGDNWLNPLMVGIKFLWWRRAWCIRERHILFALLRRCSRWRNRKGGYWRETLPHGLSMEVLLEEYIAECCKAEGEQAAQEERSILLSTYRFEMSKCSACPRIQESMKSQNKDQDRSRVQNPVGEDSSQTSKPSE